MRKIISIANHKGGVGKTCSSLNIGAGINRMGLKVLLIDLDSQGSLSQSLGITDPPATIYSALRGWGIQPVKISNGLDLIPSSLDLSGWEVEVSPKTGREVILKNLLDTVNNHYQFIIIDCPPTLSLLTVNALVASDVVFIPTQPEILALRGLTALLGVIDRIKRGLNPDLSMGGVFITQYNARKILHRNVANSLEEFFKDKLLSTRIRDNIALAEAPSQGKDIYSYSPKSYGAEDYLALSKKIMRLLT